MNDNPTAGIVSLNQFCAPGRVLLPEHDLLLAALQDAIDIFTGRQKASRGRWWTVRNWLFDDCESYLFSCVSICDHLGVSRDALLSKLRRHQREQGIPSVRPTQGIYWDRKIKRWRAYARGESGEKKYLGSFKKYRPARETVKRYHGERSMSHAA
jgi:hypothetical protein